MHVKQKDNNRCLLWTHRSAFSFLKIYVLWKQKSNCQLLFVLTVSADVLFAISLKKPTKNIQ